MERIAVHLFKSSTGSFIAELDDAAIEHERLRNKSVQGSGVTEIISALSDAMPWSKLAEVICKWIAAKSSREVIITTGDNGIIHARGYTANEIAPMLEAARSVSAIDT